VPSAPSGNRAGTPHGQRRWRAGRKLRSLLGPPTPNPRIDALPNRTAVSSGPLTASLARPAALDAPRRAMSPASVPCCRGPSGLRYAGHHGTGLLRLACGRQCSLDSVTERPSSQGSNAAYQKG
jgi:hypothetical protein